MNNDVTTELGDKLKELGKYLVDTDDLPEKIKVMYSCNGKGFIFEKDGDNLNYTPMENYNPLPGEDFDYDKNEYLKKNNASYEEDFDDSEYIEASKEFKEAIEDLDDDLFVELVEKLKDEIDINKFDELLESEHLSEDECIGLESFINIASSVLRNIIADKIACLYSIADKF